MNDDDAPKWTDLIDTKTAERLYKDAIGPAAKEIGSIGRDVANTFHLFLAPFQLLSVAQDRFSDMLDKVRASVPPDRQQEAPAEVAGPVLMNLRFSEDGSLHQKLYLNLLARAIDKDRQKEAHPGFVKIIEQMSPDEGLVFHKIALTLGPPKKERFLKEVINLVHDPRRRLEMERLVSLGLIARVPMAMPSGQIDFKGVNLTIFGEAFFTACFPQDEGP